MGAVASNWFPVIGMERNANEKFKRPKKTLRNSFIIGNTPSRSIDASELSSGIAWGECLTHVMIYLDSNMIFTLSSVSHGWSQHLDNRGSQVSTDAISNLLGIEYGQQSLRLRNAGIELIPAADWEVRPRRNWTQACDFLIGHLHSYVPRGSQTSTSMALALVSDFMMCVQTVELPENVSRDDVNRLSADSYLLAFTAIMISIKIEEGLYFEGDSIPFPREVPNVLHSTLSAETVVEAEQIILKVLKMTVPVCYFAQFARPLWYKMKSVDEMQCKIKIESNWRKEFYTPLPLNSKLSIFRFVHHASARHMDCNSGGKAIHPSIIALCVTILSVSLSHLINLKAKKNDQQLHNSRGAIAGLKRKELVHEGIDNVIESLEPLQGKISYMQNPATSSSSNLKKKARSISMITPSSSHKGVGEHGRGKEQLPDDLELMDDSKNQEMTEEAATSAPCLTAVEVFGKELILALIFDDLVDKEMRGQTIQCTWSYLAPRKALHSLNMTVHALLAHLEELSRLKVHILYQRLAKDSVACSTRSAPLDLLSALPSANSMSAASGSTHGVSKKVKGAMPSMVIAEKDSLSVETLRILFSTNRPGKGMKEGKKIINALCSISQREMSNMQTEINSALQIAFSRHLRQITAPPNRSSFSSPPANPDKMSSAMISELPYKHSMNFREGKAHKRRLSFSSDQTVQESTGIRRLEMK